MESSDAPKRPITPFFQFLQDQRKKGKVIAGKEAGKIWNDLAKSDKQPYYDEYERRMNEFNKYLEEMGYSIQAKGHHREYPEKLGRDTREGKDHYNAASVRNACGRSKDIPGFARKIYYGLSCVAVPRPSPIRRPPSWRTSARSSTGASRRSSRRRLTCSSSMTPW